MPTPPTDSKTRTQVTSQLPAIADDTRFHDLNGDGSDWGYWTGAMMKDYIFARKFRQRFDVSANQNTLTVTENSGTLPSDMAKNAMLFQYPGGKKLLELDDFTVSGSVITLNANVVLPVAAIYELYFEV